MFICIPMRVRVRTTDEKCSGAPLYFCAALLAPLTHLINARGLLWLEFHYTRTLVRYQANIRASGESYSHAVYRVRYKEKLAPRNVNLCVLFSVPIPIIIIKATFCRTPYYTYTHLLALGDL